MFSFVFAIKIVKLETFYLDLRLIFFCAIVRRNNSFSIPIKPLTPSLPALVSQGMLKPQRRFGDSRSHQSFDPVPSICVPRCNLTVYRPRFAAYTREGESIKLRSSSRSRDRGAKKNVERFAGAVRLAYLSVKWSISYPWNGRKHTRALFARRRAYDLRGERARPRRGTFAKQSVKRADLQDIIPKSGSRWLIPGDPLYTRKLE